MHHSLSGLVCSLGSALLARTLLMGKAFSILVTTTYAGVFGNIPTVHHDYTIVVIEEGIINSLTVVGAVAGYIAVWILKGILSDPEAALTIKLTAFVERIKFKRK